MDDKFLVISISPRSAYEWILKKHYAKRMTSIIYAFALVEIETKELCGVMTFGLSPNKNLGAFICGDKYKNCVIEFSRLCIDYPERKNLASWFCSRAIKQLPQQLILVSYADQNQGHIGYIYQALNWIYTGEGSIGTKEFLLSDGSIKAQRTVTGKERKDHYKDKIIERIELKPKHRYIYFHGDKRWVREAMKQLKLPSLPYPKGDSRHYDVSSEAKKSLLGFGLIRFRLSNRMKIKEEKANENEKR